MPVVTLVVWPEVILLVVTLVDTWPVVITVDSLADMLVVSQAEWPVVMTGNQVSKLLTMTV